MVLRDGMMDGRKVGYTVYIMFNGHCHIGYVMLSKADEHDNKTLMNISINIITYDAPLF